MMFDHTQEADYVLDRVNFTYENQHYSGRGMLSYDPAKGIHVQAFLDHGAPDRRFQNIGLVEIEDKSDQRALRFKGYGLTGVVPQVFQRSLRECLHERRLSIQPHSVIFFQKFPARYESGHVHKFWSGSAVFVHEKDLQFPDNLLTATTLNGEPVESQTRGGLSHSDSTGLSVWGRETGENLFTVSWALPRSHHSGREAWQFAEAARKALSIIFGQTIWMIRREVTRGIVEITELRRKQEVEILDDVHRPLTDFGPPERWKFNKSAFIHLTRFFLTGGLSADISWSIFRRLAEASRQDSWEARELLEATTLEAILRTLDNRPFKPGDRSWSVQPNLQAFFRNHLQDSKWNPVCTRILEVHRRLRHRNAHPDWVTHPGGSFSKQEWRLSIEDLTYLSRFYGYMILALSAFAPLEPKFPQVQFK